MLTRYSTATSRLSARGSLARIRRQPSPARFSQCLARKPTDCSLWGPACFTRGSHRLRSASSKGPPTFCTCSVQSRWRAAWPSSSPDTRSMATDWAPAGSKRTPVQSDEDPDTAATRFATEHDLAWFRVVRDKCVDIRSQERAILASRLRSSDDAGRGGTPSRWL